MVCPRCADCYLFGTVLTSDRLAKGDGIVDLSVGAFFDDETNIDEGAIWTVFLNSNATVKNQQQIAQGVGGFSGDLSQQDQFGHSIAALGDLDGSVTLPLLFT
jgi:hypothetical protein